MTVQEYLKIQGFNGEDQYMLSALELADVVQTYGKIKSAEDNKELIDNITSLNNNLDAYWNGSRSDARIIKIANDQQRSYELIQKHKS